MWYGGGRDTIHIHDTVFASNYSGVSVDTFNYRLPCRVMNINMDKPGKAIMFLWLHGGVYDQKVHRLADLNHFTRCGGADTMIRHYLNSAGIKAVFMIPICYKANVPHCVSWLECASELKFMINDYVDHGIVDPKRVYVAGSSDGGISVWDLAENHGSWFAAAMPLSCNGARQVSIPVYRRNTGREGDQTAVANALRTKGSNIVEYVFHADVWHGDDAQFALAPEKLSAFFE